MNRNPSAIFTPKPFPLNRFWKILKRFFVGLLLLLVVLWILIQLPPVQNWLAGYAANYLSKELKTKVEVRNVSFTLLNRINLEGIYIEDRQKDTLLSAGKMQLNISDWFFLKDSADIKYLGLTDAVIYLERTTDSIWNYQFIADYFAGGKAQPKDPIAIADTSSKGLSLHLKAIDLENVVFEQRDKYHGKTTRLALGAMEFRADKTDLSNNIFNIPVLTLTKPVYAEFGYKGLWSYQDSIAYRKRINALPPGGGFPENPGNLQLHIGVLKIDDGFLELKSRSATASVPGVFNSNDIAIQNLSGTFTDLVWNHDTLSAKLAVSAHLREGLEIKKLQADFTFHPQLMEFKKLILQLNESLLTDYFSLQFGSMDDFDDFENKVRLTGDFKNTVISTNDLAFFAPDLRSKKQKAVISGYVSGTLSDIYAKDFHLQTNGSNVFGSLRLTGLPDANHLLIDFTTPGSTLQFNDIAAWVPDLASFDNGLKQGLSTARFKGSFKGFADDFLLNGDLATNVGFLSTNLKMKLGKGKDLYDGKLTTHDLNLGKLLGIPDLGKVNFDGTVTGKGFDANTVKVKFDGKLQSAEYNKYTYTNIEANGALTGSLLNAELKMNDPNLEGAFNVKLDLKEKKRTYIADGYLSKANFKPLHFTTNDLKFSGNFDVNFTGKNIDDFFGYAKLRDAHLTNGDMPFRMDSLNIYSFINAAGKKELELETNEADASIVGKFNIADLPNSFQYFLSNYYPGIFAKPGRVVKDQDFVFAVNTKEIEAFLKLFDQKLEGLSNSSITGTINTNDNELMLNATVPYFKYGSFRMDNAMLQGNGTLTRLNLLGTVDAFRFSDSLSFYNAKLNVSTQNDSSHVQVTTSSDGQLGDAQIDALITTQEDGQKLTFNPSTIIINNKKWTINQDGEAILKNNKTVVINNLLLKQEEQEISIFTLPSTEGTTNDIHITTKKLNIGDLLPYVLKNPRLEGMATGRFTITDPRGAPHISVDTLQISEFRLDGDSIGDIRASGNYYTSVNKGKFHIVSPGKQYNFDGNIDIDLSDSTGGKINAPIVFNHTRINILNHYLNTIFDDIDGYASGQLLVKGKLDAPEFVGDIHLDSARIKVGFTKVTYFIDTGSIVMREGYMGFGKMKLRDRFNNGGTLEGGFNHHFFQDMRFNLKVSSSQMELINTRFKDNQNFYGNAVGRGSFEMTGPVNNLVMKIAAEPTDSSHISITSTTSRESGQADYIIFKQYGRAQETPAGLEDNLHIEVDLTANNKAQIDVVLDAASGDVIKAWGSGRLFIVNDKYGMTMKGRYDIERGDYNYSFQSFIRKGFDLKGDGTNYIEWGGGDPMDGIMNIDAVYETKDVRFSDLNGSDNRLSLGAASNNFKGPINVIASLRGKLTKPGITFKIELPQGSSIKNDPSANFIIDGINNSQDKSELLKQVTYLIVFNQFAPYGEGRANRNPGTELAVNTLSELVSREMGKIISNVLYQITGDRSLQVDFSTSVYNSTDLNSGNVNASGYDRTNVKFKIGKSFANNRIIVNVGSDFDFSVRSSAVNSFLFLPDISLEFILSANRKLRFIIFKKDNLQLGTRQNRAGASFSFRQDVEKLFGRHEEMGTAKIKRRGIGSSGSKDPVLKNP